MQFNLSKSLLASALILIGTWIDESSARIAAHRKLSSSDSSDDSSYAVVANRKAGSISFIPENESPNGSADGVMTVNVPGSEPMYVNVGGNIIWVDDKARNCIIVFDPEDIDAPTNIEIDREECDGLFHMGLNDEYLVVTCTMTKSIAVISVVDMEVEKYIDLEDLDTCAPHDIVINQSNEIFVTTFGECAENQIIKINAGTGMEITRKNVGENVDPHVALDPTDDTFLYSPQQRNMGGKVVIYKQNNLQEVQSLNVNNAHGICFAPDGSNLYVTDITGKGLIEIRPKTGNGNMDSAALTDVMGAFGVSPTGVAHNCAATDTGKIFVTHSGNEGQAVSLFELDDDQLENLGYYLSGGTGSMPFGIAIYRGEIEV